MHRFENQHAFKIVSMRLKARLGQPRIQTISVCLKVHNG